MSLLHADASGIDLALSDGTKALAVPDLASTEEAIEWGSSLNAEQYETLVEMQRMLSIAALAESNLQRMIDLATRSQLMREAAEAFVSVHSNGLRAR